jgi:hypothetical protein
VAFLQRFGDNGLHSFCLLALNLNGLVYVD